MALPISCSRPARRAERIETQFAGHHAGNVSHLDGVLQDVLTVAGAVAQAAEDLDQLG